MFEKIVLAYDGSPSSIEALRYAADLSGRYGGELHLLGVIHSAGRMEIDPMAPNDAWGMEKDHIQQAMNLARIELDRLGQDAVIETRMGDPAEQIIGYADQIQAGLVVVGHSDKGILARWLGGSVGSDLLDHLRCPLLITRQAI